MCLDTYQKVWFYHGRFAERRGERSFFEQGILDNPHIFDFICNTYIYILYIYCMQGR